MRPAVSQHLKLLREASLVDVNGTLVEFEHRDLDRFGRKADEQRAGMDGGWGELLNGFERLASSGAMRDRTEDRNEAVPRS